MVILWTITGGALIASFIADRRKTIAAALRGFQMLRSILPLLLGALSLVSLFLATVTPETMQRVLAGRGLQPFLAAFGIGSVALIPGFIAYPLTAVFKQRGASYAVQAAFITSLMMVGVLTLPIEAKFFGWRVSLLRNGLALFGALLVAVGMAWVLT